MMAHSQRLHETHALGQRLNQLGAGFRGVRAALQGCRQVDGVNLPMSHVGPLRRDESCRVHANKS